MNKNIKKQVKDTKPSWRTLYKTTNSK